MKQCAVLNRLTGAMYRKPIPKAITKPLKLLVWFCNNEAVKTFSMVLGAYNTSKGKIWIIAESSTGNEYDRLTVLFPNEY